MDGMYYVLFDMLSGYIYGTNAVLTGDQQLTLTLICTIGALFVVAMPFLVTWRFVRMFI